MDFDILRRTMIDTQIRTWDVLDPRVLAIVTEVKRELFVPTAYRHLAFADYAMPIAHGEHMWTPKMEARVLQELDLREHHRVLEIGTGTGHMAALMARLSGMVHSVEDRADLSQMAEGHLRVQGIHNVQLHVGDGSCGWAGHAPYDAICVTGSLPVLPEAFKEQLAVGGRLVAIIGKGPAMRAQRISRTQQDVYETAVLFETEVTPLRHAPLHGRFVF